MLRKRFISIPISFFILFLSSSIFISSSHATEPPLANGNLFTIKQLVKTLTSKDSFYKYSCSKESWDPNSRNTEYFVRCNKKNAEIYMHANYVDVVTAPLTFFSVTVKKPELYGELSMHVQMCSSKMSDMRENLDKFDSNVKDIIEWNKKLNYANMKPKSVMKKTVGQHSLQIVAGSGSTRTVSCGVKPSK
jgi:hypothetical protein